MRDWMKEDIELVRDNARIVVTISPDNRSFSVVENKRPRLGVIAVIGASEGHKDEANRSYKRE